MTRTVVDKGDRGHDWRGGIDQTLVPKLCPAFGLLGSRASCPLLITLDIPRLVDPELSCLFSQEPSG